MKNLNTKFFSLVLGFSFVSCSHMNEKVTAPQKIILDSSNVNRPEWVSNSKIGWTDQNVHYLKGSYNVESNQRISSCYDLAKIDLRENLVTELSSEVKGEIVSALKGTRIQNGENITKTMIQRFEGRIQGLRIEEQYFERFLINEREQADCYVLGTLTQDSYINLKNNILNGLKEEDSELKRALENKQINFIKDDN